MKPLTQSIHRFWAGGAREFHRQRGERDIAKVKTGWFNSIFWKVKLYLVTPMIREIDQRLFIKKAGKK